MFRNMKICRHRVAKLITMGDKSLKYTAIVFWPFDSVALILHPTKTDEGLSSSNMYNVSWLAEK